MSHKGSTAPFHANPFCSGFLGCMGSLPNFIGLRPVELRIFTSFQEPCTKIRTVFCVLGCALYGFQWILWDVAASFASCAAHPDSPTGAAALGKEHGSDCTYDIDGFSFDY